MLTTNVLTVCRCIENRYDIIDIIGIDIIVVPTWGARPTGRGGQFDS